MRHRVLSLVAISVAAIAAATLNAQTYPLDLMDPTGAGFTAGGVSDAARGWAFTVNAENVTVDSLGCFYSDITTTAHTVTLFEESTGNIVAQTSVGPGTSSGWLFATLTTPVLLTNGTKYVISGFSATPAYYYHYTPAAAWHPTGIIEYTEGRASNSATANTMPGFETTDYIAGLVDIGYTASPDITSTAPTNAFVGNAYSYTVTATGTGTVTYSISPNPSTLGSGWLTWDGTDTLSGTPAASDIGVDIGPFTITATNGITPDDTEVITVSVSSNVFPTITVTENSNAVAADQVITIALNDTVTSMALSFVAQDADSADTVTVSTSVSPSGNITGFTQSEWDQATAANPTTAATPTTGTVDVAGLITVIVTATDNNSAATTFRFFILVPVSGNTAPTVSLPTGSAFTGNVTSGFTYNGMVNTALANATIQLDDVDMDNMAILSETGTIPPGVVTPGAGTGIPDGSTGSFTGTPTATGTYVVTYTLTDNNTAPVIFSVTFVIAGTSGGGGGGGGDDDSGCSTGSNGTYNWMLLLGLLGAFVVFTRVGSSKT